MLSFAPELIKLVQSRQEALIQVGIAAVSETAGLSEYSPADLKQMVIGFIALLTEALEETGTDTLKFYTQTVIPGLVAKGDSVAKIVHAVMFFSVTQIVDLAFHLPVEHRAEASMWLAKFYAGYMSEIVANGIIASQNGSFSRPQ